ncbi:MAG: peroxidase family protein [Pseudomonadota bacterium]
MTLLLSGCGGSGGSDTAAAAAQLSAISAGTDQTVAERSVVSLTGVMQGDGSVATLAWTQVSGVLVDLADPAALATSFVAPSVRSETELRLRLTVTDTTGKTLSDELVVRVEDLGSGPDGPSPQGIPNTAKERRDRARRDRPSRRMVDSREVRSYDGSSNNLANPDWGAAFTHLQRLAASDYADGIDDLAGPQRPSARVISNEVHDQAAGVSVPNAFDATDFLWQWGQFIDHDLDLTDGAEEAANIAVPTGDVFFDPTGTGTVELPFNRALFDPETGFTIDNPREQDNEITAWIDGSMIYGWDADRAAALRVGPDSPFLATSDGDLLPFNIDGLVNANGFITDASTLFLAGDVRANEQLGLAVMHTLFVREHNRIAALLQADNPGRSADEVFEAARRLVIAKLQIITFEEWLPVLVGADAIAPYEGYDDSVNPSIFNEFSVAAFRLGHSLVNEQLLRLDAEGAPIDAGHVAVAQAFFTAPMLLRSRDDLDPLLRGLASQRHQQLDPGVISTLRNFLFGQPGDGGLDLVSLNIQRGRDHGVPGYNAMREALGLGSVSTFSQITDDTQLAAALAASYTSVDDVDLWTGGLAEDAVPGSQLGPVFQEIVTRQFTALRDGDRFWYERDLTSGERSLVRGTTLASVIRANTEIGDELQDDVFLMP